MSAPLAEPARKLPEWPLAAAALLPLILYIFTADGAAYWLDSAEFTASAVDLDIPHPPGHPVASLWGKLFTFLPFGPLPFRVALSQAAACAIALACVQRAIARSVQRLGLFGSTAQLTGLGGAWFLAGTYGFWFQAVRAEVYALQAALVCFALERASLLATRAPEETDARPFYQATLAIGIGLANHHFISVLALPPLLWSFVRLVRAQGVRPLLWGLATGLLGLSTYAYLPLRASRLPPMDLGHPVGLGSLAWVVSAKVYAKKIGTGAIQPLGERFADLVVILVESFWLPTLLFTVFGAYVLIRKRASWELAYLWLSTAAISLLGRAWLNPVRANPDVLGYMMPGFAAVMALAMCGLAVFAVSVGTRGAQTVAAVLALSWGLSSLAVGAPQASLARLDAPDVFDEVRYRELPEQTCLVLVNNQTIFRHYGASAVERVRNDLWMVPVPFLDYAGTGEQLARKQPELAALIHDYLARQTLSPEALSALRARCRVLVELDTATTLPLISLLIPNGLFFELRATPPKPEEIAQSAAQKAKLYGWLYERIGAQLDEQETKRQLLWLHYMDALYYTFHGLYREAQVAAMHGLELAPQTPELLKLTEALNTARGPIDIRAFLVGQ
jgi:hypothetical protein